jgi:hypothetical protein
MSVTLDKASDKSPYGGHNSQTFYTKNADGSVPEWVLAQIRYNNGARVSAEWAYYLRNNDLRELREFYRHG